MKTCDLCGDDFRGAGKVCEPCEDLMEVIDDEADAGVDEADDFDQGGFGDGGFK